MSASVKCGSRTLLAKSCTKCHVFKQAVDFPKDPRGFWVSWCTACRYASAKTIVRRENDASLEKATHHLESWTTDDIDLAWRLTNLGLSNRQIGERLGRTTIAVQVMKSVTRVYKDDGVKLRYYDSRSDRVFTVGKPFHPEVKGHFGRLNKTAQELSQLHTQLIFFLEVCEGGECMGIRGLDALKEGDDREPEDTSEDLEALTHPSQNEN